MSGDQFPILELISLYSYTYDTKDSDGFSKLFTEDATWEMFLSGSEKPEIRLESREAIRLWADDRLKGRQGKLNSRHHQSGTVFLKLTANMAETRTMVLVTHVEIGNAFPKPTLSGEYRDLFKKTEEGWKFFHRQLLSDQFGSSP